MTQVFPDLPNPDPRLLTTAQMIESLTPDTQLMHLKHLCDTHGVWGIPSDLSEHRHVLFEVSLFGVSAMANDPEELPRNWCRVARAVGQVRACA